MGTYSEPKATTATARNLLTGDVLKVKATVDHPASSYGRPVWVTAEGEALGECGYPVLGFEIEID